MKILKANLIFNGGFSDLGTAKRIILHHSESKKSSVEDINKWHKENGWIGIGYHFLVRKDGTVWEGRPIWALGAHCLNHNKNSIGVCFEGNFNVETMESKQLNAGIELINYLLKLKGLSTKDVYRHKDFMATDCPGNNFPFNKFKNGSTSQNTDKQTGVFVVNVNSYLNIREKASTSSNIVGKYYSGESVNFDRRLKNEGYEWISWIGASGNRRYMAIKNLRTGESYGRIK